MNRPLHRTDPAPDPADDAATRARLRAESEMIDEGLADLENGGGLSGPALNAWLKAFVKGAELPETPTGR